MSYLYQCSFIINYIIFIYYSFIYVVEMKIHLFISLPIAYIICLRAHRQPLYVIKNEYISGTPNKIKYKLFL